MTGHRRTLLIASAVAVGIGVLYATGALPALPDPKKAIEDIAQALGPWTYALVGLLAFLETGAFVGLVAPGETTVIVGGVIAGQGEIELIPLIGLVWTCSVLGDTTSFFIGRRLGRDFIVKHGPRIKIDEKRLEQVESYFERHGGKTILIGRFIGLVRALAPFVAGSSGLSYRRFVPFSIIGCGVWGSLFAVLGFVFYRSFDQVAGIAGKATLAFGITVAVIAGLVYLVRRHRERLRAWLERSSWSLELATTAAVAGVGGYVVALYTVLLEGGRETTPADRELLDVADDLRSAAVVDVVRVLTGLGAFPTVAALVVGVAVALALRRRIAELAGLVAAAVVIYAGVQLLKSGVDRPRPSGPLTGTEGSSFPSGHAAYSTLWLGVAVVAARVTPGLARGVTLTAAGLAIAIAVGLSRIYLRAHYWSDVAAGWGVGVAALGACGVAVLVVARFRNNPRSTR